MTGLPPSVAPDPSEPLTPQSWNTYRRTLDQWRRQWDDIDASMASQGPDEDTQVLSQTPSHHPEYKGRSYGEISDHLRAEARLMQALYKSRIKYPKPGPLTEAEEQETKAATLLMISWSLFGGGNWQEMNARQLDSLIHSQREGNLEQRIEMDHRVLANNRFAYIHYEEVTHQMGKKPGLSDFVRVERELEMYPNETNIAEWVRKSRPTAVVAGVLALIAGATFGFSALTVLGGVLVAYLVLSFVMYPKLLRPS